MWRFLASLVLALVISIDKASAASDPVELLCGPRPAADSLTPPELGAQEERLRALEREMPPVTDQGRSDWCFAHVAAALLDQYLHGNSPGAYAPARLISIIDLAEQGGISLRPYFRTNSPASDSADYNGTLDPLEILLFAQDQGAVRSDAQLLALTSDEAAARRRLAQFADDAPSAADNPFRAHPNEMNLVNNWEILRDWVRGDFSHTDLQRYRQIISLGGPPELRLPDFVVHRLTTRDPARAAAQIRASLQAGQPLAFFIRGRDVPGHWTPYNPDETHIMILVGAGYDGTNPVVRLRNSWGPVWGENGYFTSPAADFLGWLKNGGSPRGNCVLTWISPPPGTDAPPKQVRLEDDFSIYTGTMKDLPFAGRAGGRFHRFREYTGTRVFTDGRTVIYREGRRINPP